jgi:hypothetical protein
MYPPSSASTQGDTGKGVELLLSMWQIPTARLKRVVFACLVPYSHAWCRRNVHPTTRLLQPFPGSDRLPPGILVISSRDVLLCTCLGSSLQQQQHQQSNSQQRSSSSHAAAQAHAAPAAISGMQETTGSKLLGDGVCARQLQVAQWAPPGLPMSCTALPGSSLIVGDSRAGGLVVDCCMHEIFTVQCGFSL